MVPALRTALGDRRVSPWDFQLLFLLVVAYLDIRLFREIKVAALCRDLLRHREAVAKSLERLVQLGYLEMEPRPHPGAMSRYRLCWAIEPAVSAQQHVGAGDVPAGP